MIALVLALDLAAVVPGGTGDPIAVDSRGPVAVMLPDQLSSVTVPAADVRALRLAPGAEQPVAEVSGTLSFRAALAHEGPRLRFHTTRAIDEPAVHLAAGVLLDELARVGVGGGRVRATVRLSREVVLEGVELPIGAIALGGGPGDDDPAPWPMLAVYPAPQGAPAFHARIDQHRLRAMLRLEREAGRQRVRLRAGESRIDAWVSDHAPEWLGGRRALVPSVCPGYAYRPPAVERRMRIAPGTRVIADAGERAWATVGQGVVARVLIAGDRARILELPGVGGCVAALGEIPAASLSDP